MINQNLYQQLILDHNRSPRNYGKLDNPTHFSEGYNALCGDHFLIYLNLDSSGRIVEEIKFSGEGCAISKASASMMSEIFTKKSIDEVRELFDLFKRLVKGQPISQAEEKKISKLIIFANIHKYPSRIKCAILAWHAVAAALDNKKQTSSENVEI